MTPRKKQMRRCRYPIVFAGVLIVFAVVLLGGIFSKYIQKTTKDNKTVSSEFYFTSPMLSETGTDYTLSPGTTTIKIPVCNYADDLRYSAKEIYYSYQLKKDDAEVKNGSGTIPGGEKQTSTILLTDLSAGTYMVTVTASSPFQTTLTGTIHIEEEVSEVHYSVSDQQGSPYVLLTVWTDNYAGKVTLEWPAGLIPDSTDTQMAKIQTYSENAYHAEKTTVSVEEHSSYVYRFFKEDSTKSYNNQQLTAVKGT